MRPPGGTDEQGSDWFSIFVLHQNRVEHGYGQKNAIQPEYLERFLDLVIWGHEHECIPDPWVSHTAVSYYASAIISLGIYQVLCLVLDGSPPVMGVGCLGVSILT